MGTIHTVGTLGYMIMDMMPVTVGGHKSLILSSEHLLAEFPPYLMHYARVYLITDNLFGRAAYDPAVACPCLCLYLIFDVTAFPCFWIMPYGGILVINHLPVFVQYRIFGLIQSGAEYLLCGL